MNALIGEFQRARAVSQLVYPRSLGRAGLQARVSGVPFYSAVAAEGRDLSDESGFLFWLADAALNRRSTRTFADTASQKLR